MRSESILQSNYVPKKSGPASGACFGAMVALGTRPTNGAAKTCWHHIIEW